MTFIGDPTPIGWLIAFSFIFAGWRSWKTAVLLRDAKQSFLFWILLTLILVFFAVNKQLDMQSWLYEGARNLMRARGLQGEKELFKLLLLVGLIGVLIIGCLTFITAFKLQFYRPWGALSGCLLLFFFVLLRAVAFNQLQFLNGWKGGGWEILELTGIVLILVSTYKLNRQVSANSRR